MATVILSLAVIANAVSIILVVRTATLMRRRVEALETAIAEGKHISGTRFVGLDGDLRDCD
ncbi:hypothetical protein [Sediminivirga luteola]|uniref:Uncharacterized protein n=1 Tax=Sediminivirga luteola TaxID=1774748 RepID=A0A8J2TXC5_9MICO|nr:hypothetical protein [Sediminivirga luteola]GGA11024.1 hypothetical protein GCM10011333_12330 [Sediminivirga luteola]